MAGNEVYALIQSDSDSVPVISQTLVNIVAFDRATGQIASTRFVKLPDVKGAITEFVYEGPESFRLDGGKLVVKGEYGIKGDAADTRTPFMDSVPVEEAE